VQGNATHYAQGNRNQNAQNDHPKVQLSVDASSTNRVIQAEVLYNAKPTHYFALFAITQEASSLEEADKFMNQRLENFKAAVQRLGVSDDQFFTDFISLVPKYEVQVDKKRWSKTANEVPIGFQLKKNVHIGFTDAKLLDRILSAAAVNEIYDLAKVEVSNKDMAKIQAEIKAEAQKIVKAKAEAFTALGLKMIPLSMGDNFEVYFPDENYENYTASATDYSELQQNQQYLKGKLGIKYAAKNTTVYYNRLPYDQFDLVMNPEIVEPPIQIHYKVAVNYVVESPEIIERQKANEQRQEAVRKDELEIRKLQAQQPIKCCNEKK
jgi:uncharacterized protein YggE